MRSHRIRITLAFVLASLVAACSSPTPTYVRDTDVVGLDDPAMSLGLDARDIDRLFLENLNAMQSSAWYNAQAGGDRQVVAVLTIANQTTEHVDGALDALIGRVETDLVNSGRYDVVAYDMREQILHELEMQQGAAFDASRAMPLGRQLGVHYFVTGRLYDNAERTAEMRRVQYFMFMQAIEVATGRIAWQAESNLTKGLVPLDD